MVGLIGSCLGLFILMLDSTIVSLALTSIRHEPGFTLFGIALGLVYAPMSSAAMAAMPPNKAGIAAGVLAMTRVLAGAVALAATGAVFGSLESDGETFTYALSHALWILVGLTTLGALLTWAFVRAPREKGPDPAVAGDPAPAELRHHTHHRRFHL